MQGTGAPRSQAEPLRVLVWGTYDLSKPRTRILLRGLEESGASVQTLHASVWGEIADKTTLRSARERIRFAVRWLASYARLLRQLRAAKGYDVLLVLYLGQLDVLVLWPFAKLRKVPVVWDQFISLYDTVVDDRRLLSPRHPAARLLFAWEWLACRAADRVLMDTEAHAEYVRCEFRLPRSRVAVVPVGVEPEVFPVAGSSTREPPGAAEPAPGRREDGGIHALFYGQFIPLHGIDTIVRAAQLTRGEGIRWTLIGRGQEQERIARMLRDDWPEELEWIEWVEYGELIRHIRSADVCLGIFGDTNKAARVIPNKVYQILQARRPLVTRDSPAIRELVSEGEPGIYRVRPADPQALLGALRHFRAERAALASRPLYEGLLPRIGPAFVGRQLARILEDASSRRLGERG